MRAERIAPYAIHVVVKGPWTISKLIARDGGEPLVLDGTIAAETVRGIANQAANDCTLIDERVRNSILALEASVAARDGRRPSQASPRLHPLSLARILVCQQN